jgi:hypothetical protein
VTVVEVAVVQLLLVQQVPMVEMVVQVQQHTSQVLQ